MSPAELSSSEAERLRAFERQGHDALAKSYHAFFAGVTGLATDPLLDAVHLHPGTRLLDVASGPGALAAEAANRGARPVGVDLSPQMIELARRLHPAIEFREADVEHLPFADVARTFSPTGSCYRRVRADLAARRTHCIILVGSSGAPANPRHLPRCHRRGRHIGVAGRTAGPQCVPFL